MSSPVKIWRNQQRIRNLLNKKGIIVTWTMIYVPPSGFSEYAPYPVAVIELTDGERITAQVVDYVESELTIGQNVKTVLRKVMEPTDDGVIPYGIKVKPISEEVW